MSSTRTRAQGRAESTIRLALSHEAAIVAAALAVAAGLAWAWLLGAAGSMDRMPGMTIPADPWSVEYLVPAFGMWAVMMVAMMLPSAAPMILLHSSVDRSPSERTRLANTLLFAAAYLVVWAMFAAAASAGQALLISAGVLSAAVLVIADSTVATGLLLTAALYELTAAKRLCLEKCQSPVLFLVRHRRPGAFGAFRLGTLHGLFCVGCCWALMLLLFVGGVMNLVWVAALGIAVLGEKLAPPAWRANRWMAALLVLAAILILWRSGGN